MREPHDDGLTRRQVLAMAGGAVGAAATGCAPTGAHPRPETQVMNPSTQRMPVVYVPHGGGPWPFVDMGMGSRAELDGLTAYLRGLKSLPHTPPRAILAVSAHWEEPEVTVQTGAHPPLLFDYYGFPEASYRLTWPAPGEPAVAARVQQLLTAAGIPVRTDSERGFDHGTFVPLKLTYPNADVPCLQLSLKEGLDPATHLALGRAIAPLRDEGVFIVGSGMSFHNLRAFRGGAPAQAAAGEFDAWLNDAVVQDPEERDRRLRQWASAPSARASHPREEHLLPLMVVAGAAGRDRGTVAYNNTLLGMKISAHHFG